MPAETVHWKINVAKIRYALQEILENKKASLKSEEVTVLSCSGSWLEVF